MDKKKKEKGLQPSDHDTQPQLMLATEDRSFDDANVSRMIKFAYAFENLNADFIETLDTKGSLAAKAYLDDLASFFRNFILAANEEILTPPPGSAKH